MWGNLTGWIIAAGLAAALFFLGSTIVGLGRPSDPVPIARLVNGKPSGKPMSPAESLAKLELPVSPKSIVQPEVNGDAGPKLREAIAALNEGDVLRQYDRFVNSTRRQQIDYDRLPMRPIELLIEAGRMRSMRFLDVAPEKSINYDTESRTELRQIDLVAKAAIALGYWKAFKPQGADAMQDAPGARRIFESVFVLGGHLFDERVVYDELNVGLEWMASAAGGLMKLAKEQGNTELLARLETFDSERAKYVVNHIIPIWRVISSMADNVIAQHAGNVFQLAEQSEDPVWRVEAILKIGRFRFSAGRAGDQGHADRILRRLARETEDDPRLRAAVSAAKTLTVEQFRLIR